MDGRLEIILKRVAHYAIDEKYAEAEARGNTISRGGGGGDDGADMSEGGADEDDEAGYLPPWWHDWWEVVQVGEGLLPVLPPWWHDWWEVVQVYRRFST